MKWCCLLLILPCFKGAQFPEAPGEGNTGKATKHLSILLDWSPPQSYVSLLHWEPRSYPVTPLKCWHHLRPRAPTNSAGRENGAHQRTRGPLPQPNHPLLILALQRQLFLLFLLHLLAYF